MCKVNQMVQSKKEDARIAKIVEIGEKVKLEFVDNGEVREVSESTFKRWYKKVDEVATTSETTPAETTPSTEGTTPAAETTPATETTPSNEGTTPDAGTNPPADTTPKTPKTPKEPKAPKGDKKESNFKPLFEKLVSAASQWNEVEVKKTPSYTALKAKKLFAEIHLTAKNLVVYILPVLEGVDTTGVEVKKVPEKFRWTLDTGLNITDDASLEKALKLIAISYDYRINNKKVEKKQA